MAVAIRSADSFSVFSPKISHRHRVRFWISIAASANRSSGQRFAGPYSAPAFSPNHIGVSEEFIANLNLDTNCAIASSLTLNFGGNGSGFAPIAVVKLRYW